MFILLLQHVDTVFKHKDLQQQLVDAKLHQAQALLKDSEDRHQKEKEFVSFWLPRVYEHGHSTRSS